MRPIHLYGNHRGGTSLVRQMPVDVAARYDRSWTLADPKGDRAERLAVLTRERFPFVEPTPKRAAALATLAAAPEDAAVILALDSVDATAELVSNGGSRRSVSFQLVGRGPGGHSGVRAAFQGTLLPGDHATKDHASLLLTALGELTRDASSRQMTSDDPLAGAVLRPLRECSSAQTLRHLAEAGRDPGDLSNGPLTVAFGPRVLPLVCASSTAGDARAHRRQLALDLAGEFRDHQLAEHGPVGRVGVVALVIVPWGVIEFLRVARTRHGDRRVIGVTVFAPPIPEPAIVVRPALFTD